MNEDDYRVPALSWAAVGEKADRFRSSLGLSKVEQLPIIDILERVLDHELRLIEFLVGDYEEMRGAEGYTCPRGSFIMLRNDVYAGACADEPRARFTAAHELGHFVMHANMPLARAKRGDGTPGYCLAEPQANQFAAEILAPRGMIDRWDTEDSLMLRFGISRDAARLRITYMREKIFK